MENSRLPQWLRDAADVGGAVGFSLLIGGFILEQVGTPHFPAVRELVDRGAFSLALSVLGALAMALTAVLGAGAVVAFASSVSSAVWVWAPAALVGVVGELVTMATGAYVLWERGSMAFVGVGVAVVIVLLFIRAAFAVHELRGLDDWIRDLEDAWP